MDLIKLIILQGIAFSSGVVISGGVFAFIAGIGMVPRIAKKTKTKAYISWYETAITLGGFLGIGCMFFNLYLPIGKIMTVLFSLCIGIFWGCLAVSLAEVLDVIPILSRRGKLTKGLACFVTAIAMGKFVGSILYYCIPGFYAN